MTDSKSNNSQHGMTAQQAADNVRGSYAAHWAAAHHGIEIRGGYARPDGFFAPLIQPSTRIDTPGHEVKP